MTIRELAIAAEQIYVDGHADETFEIGKVQEMVEALAAQNGFTREQVDKEMSDMWFEEMVEDLKVVNR